MKRFELEEINESSTILTPYTTVDALNGLVRRERHTRRSRKGWAVVEYDGESRREVFFSAVRANAEKSLARRRHDVLSQGG